MPSRQLLPLLLAFCCSISFAADKAPAVGDKFQDCRNCPTMVVLPAGKFIMGSPADEPERRDSEPQHAVTISKSFALATTPVTWNQWEACVRDRWCEGEAIEIALSLGRDGKPDPNYKDYGRGTRP